MAYFKEKRVKGKKYRYLCRSFRLPDGKVHTIEKAVGKEKGSAQELYIKHSKFFEEREKKALSASLLQGAGEKEVNEAAFAREANRLLSSVKSRRYKQLLVNSLENLSRGFLKLTGSEYFRFWADIHNQNNVVFFRVTSSINPVNWKEAEMQVYSASQMRNIESYRNSPQKEKEKYWRLVKKKFPGFDFQKINFERIFLVEKSQLKDREFLKMLAETVASQNWEIPVRVLCTDEISKSEYEDFGIVLLANGDRFLMSIDVMENRAVGGGKVIFNDSEIKKYMAIYQNMRLFSQPIKRSYSAAQIEERLRRLKPSVSMKNACIDCYDDTEKKLLAGEWKAMAPCPAKMWYEIWSAEGKAITEFAKKLKPRRIIEPGCGSGRIIRLLLDSGIKADKVVGLEQNEAIYGSVLRRFRKDDRVNILHCLVQKKESVPYDSDYFDLCINSSNLIGWQGNEHEWIKEMMRVSRVLYFTVYKKGYESERVEMYKTRNGHRDVKIDENCNVLLDNVDAFYKQSKLSKSYSRKELEKLCRKHSKKFDIEEISKHMYGCALYK